MLRTVALSGLAALVIAVDWLRFEEPRSSGGRPFVLAVLAIAPVLLRPLWPRVVGVAVSVVLGLWVALSVSPLSLWPGGDGYFGPLASRFGNGFGDFYEFRLPITPDRHPQMHEVILVAIFVFTLVVALAIASRRVLLAVVTFLVGAGWPATLLSRRQRARPRCRHPRGRARAARRHHRPGQPHCARRNGGRDRRGACIV